MMNKTAIDNKNKMGTSAISDADYSNLTLAQFENVHFAGDALSARGITVSGAQGTYVAESILKENG